MIPFFTWRDWLSFACWILTHPTPPGVTRERSIAYVCDRCGQVVPGRLGARR